MYRGSFSIQKILAHSARLIPIIWYFSPLFIQNDQWWWNSVCIPIGVCKILQVNFISNNTIIFSSSWSIDVWFVRLIGAQTNFESKEWMMAIKQMATQWSRYWVVLTVISSFFDWWLMQNMTLFVFSRVTSLWTQSTRPLGNYRFMFTSKLSSLKE